MTLFSLAFLCGIVFLQQFSYLPDNYWVGILLFCVAITYKKSKILIAFMLGFAWALWFAHLQSSWILPKDLEGKPNEAIGVIASIPNVSNHKTSFLFKLESFNHGKVR